MIVLYKDEIIKNTINDDDVYKYGARGIKRKVKKEILKQVETKCL